MRALLIALATVPIFGLPAAAQTPRPVKVFILAGQSNMEGKGFPEPLAYQVGTPEYRERWTAFIEGGDHGAFTERYQASLKSTPREPDYAWSEREDVWIEFLGVRGDLTVGYGVPDKCFGPELGFGHVIGDHFDQQVLIIKTAWGGKSLGQDFLSPSATQPSEEDLARMASEENARIEQHNEKNPDRKRPMVSAEQIKGRYGHYYREMLRLVRETLGDLPARFPGYADQGYELGGFVWFQGWNDQFNPAWYGGYGENMGALIRDLRRDLDAPELPVVVGVVGFDGLADEPTDRNGEPTARAHIKRGQAAMAELFPGSVAAVETAPFWDMDADGIYRGPGGWKADVEKWRQFGNERPYHYLGSPWFFAQAGRAFGQAMLPLLDGED